MRSKDEEYRELFSFEALEISEQLNKLFAILEQNHGDLACIEAVLRLTHTLKANSLAIGQAGIAEISHGLEDIFSSLKSNPALLTAQLFDELFKANDKLRVLINAVKNQEQVPYKGLKTKLSVLVGNLKEKISIAVEEPRSEPSDQTASTEIAFSEVIQVPIGKLDGLLNLVGELSIEKDRLATLHPEPFKRLSRLVSDLHYAVMDVRLVQIDVLFHKFYRVVRDIAVKEGKIVNLMLAGTDIEIDRSLLQALSDSLVHLVRNCVSHGIESPNERLSKGKTENGTLSLSATSDKSYVVITIADDGRGISTQMIRKKAVEKGFATSDSVEKLTDDQVLEFIFQPGFSGTEALTDVAGRGIGLDVVRKSIQSIGGRVSLQTQDNKGTVFELKVPASMAVKNVLLFELKNSIYAIALSYIEAVVCIEKNQIHFIQNSWLISYLDRSIAVLFLNDFFDNQSAIENDFKTKPQEKVNLIITTFEGRQVGLVVDKLLQQKEIVEKPLSKPLGLSRYISGASIMGDGTVCLVVNVAAIYEKMFKGVFV